MLMRSRIYPVNCAYYMCNHIHLECCIFILCVLVMYRAGYSQIIPINDRLCAPIYCHLFYPVNIHADETSMQMKIIPIKAIAL